ARYEGRRTIAAEARAATEARTNARLFVPLRDGDGPCTTRVLLIAGSFVMQTCEIGRRSGSAPAHRLVSPSEARGDGSAERRWGHRGPRRTYGPGSRLRGVCRPRTGSPLSAPSRRFLAIGTPLLVREASNPSLPGIGLRAQSAGAAS